MDPLELHDWWETKGSGVRLYKEVRPASALPAPGNYARPIGRDGSKCPLIAPQGWLCRL